MATAQGHAGKANFSSEYRELGTHSPLVSSRDPSLFCAMGHGSLVPPMVPSLRNVLKLIKNIGLQRKSVILKSYSSYENSGESRRIN